MHQPFSTDSLVSEVTDPCPLCGGDTRVTDLYTGEVICTTCGCVLNELILSRRVIYFDGADGSDGRRHGVGLRQSIYDTGLNTVIRGNKDGYGVTLSKETVSNMHRLQRHDMKSKVNDSVQRNLSAAMAEMDRMCTVLHLPLTVKEGAAHLYRKTLKRDLIRGRSIDSFVAACIYATCRLHEIPRPLSLVVEESKREYDEVSMTYRFIVRELKLKMPLDDPFKYIPKLASKLGLSRQVELLAVDYLQKSRDKGVLMGKDPRGLCAASLFLASLSLGERVVQRQLAKACETTEVTLRNRYREMAKALDIEL